MSVVAVIPARGGSKGVPGKNVALVGGRALVARAVDAARRAELVDRVLVSTDDRLVAEVAREAGAEVVVRPDELAGDGASGVRAAARPGHRRAPTPSSHCSSSARVRSWTPPISTGWPGRC